MTDNDLKTAIWVIVEFTCPRRLEQVNPTLKVCEACPFNAPLRCVARIMHWTLFNLNVVD